MSRNFHYQLWCMEVQSIKVLELFHSGGIVINNTSLFRRCFFFEIWKLIDPFQLGWIFIMILIVINSAVTCWAMIICISTASTQQERMWYSGPAREESQTVMVRSYIWGPHTAQPNWFLIHSLLQYYHNLINVLSHCWFPSGALYKKLSTAGTVEGFYCEAATKVSICHWSSQRTSHSFLNTNWSTQEYNIFQFSDTRAVIFNGEGLTVEVAAATIKWFDKKAAGNRLFSLGESQTTLLIYFLKLHHCKPL